jgi:cysteine dioxygenase
MAICWEVGQGSSIHNHKGQNCWMAVPVGKLMVQNFRVVSEDLSAHSCNLETADTVEMHASNPVAVNPAQPVHSVFNPRELKQRAVSLHVYSLPFDSCIVYSLEQHTCGEIKLHFNTEFGVPVK